MGGVTDRLACHGRASQSALLDGSEDTTKESSGAAPVKERQRNDAENPHSITIFGAASAFAAAFSQTRRAMRR